MAKRNKTKYPGVYYRKAQRIGGKGIERVYYITFKQNGKTLEERVGRQFADGMTEARANQYRSARIEGRRQSRKEIREAEKAAKVAESDRWTFNRLWEEYKTRKPDGKSISIDEGRYNKYLKELIGDKQPSEVSQFEMDKIRVTLLKVKSAQTVKHILSLAKRLSNFAIKKGITDGFSFVVEMPRVDNQKTEDLSPTQLKSLLQALEDEPDRDIAHIMLLALYSGMRRGEILRLRWDDIDFDRGFIRIVDPKGGRSQTIPLNDEACKVLKSQHRTRSPLVFPNKDGDQRYQITREANRVKARANLPRDFRPLHGLRHTYASILASSGKVDMYVLQRLMTHKSPQMTQRYSHLRDETLKHAAELAGELIKHAGDDDESVVEFRAG